MIRLFVGLALPDAARQRLAGMAGGIPNARWVPAENYHVTLRFIGEIDEVAAEDVHVALSTIRGPAFEVVLAGLGTFGADPHTLWIGVERNPALGHLREKVESAVVRAGLAAESRRFSPHVTLARLKASPPGRVQSFVESNHRFRDGPIAVDRFVLFSSRLGRGGAVYTAVADYPLGEG